MQETILSAFSTTNPFERKLKCSLYGYLQIF